MATSRLDIIIEAQNQAKRQLDNLSNQLRRISDDQRKFADATVDAETSFLGFTSAIGVGVLAANLAESAIRSAGRALKGFIGDSINTALSVERLAATLPVLARNTGKTEAEIKRIIFAIRSENKSILEATEITRGIVLAGLDEVDALKLLTVARDIGATVGRSSADTNRLILESFQTLNPGILKQIGLNISLRTVFRELADQLGKTVAGLTTTERQVGLLNAIFLEGEKFAGAYDAAMTTVQKVTNSVRDASKDVNFVFGALLTEGFFPIVQASLDGVRAFRAWAITSENELNPQLQAIAETIGVRLNQAFNIMLAVVGGIVEAFRLAKQAVEELLVIEAVRIAFGALAAVWNETVLPLLKFLIGDVDTLKIFIKALVIATILLITAAIIPLVAVIIKATAVVVGIIAVVRLLEAGFTALFFAGFELARGIRETWTKIKFQVTNAITAMLMAVTNFFLTVKRFFFAIGVILGIFNDSVVFAREFLIQNFGQMGATIVRFAEIVKFVFDAIKGFLERTWTSIVSTALAALDLIAEKVGEIISRITAIPRAISAAVGGAFTRARTFVGLQEGGIVTRPTRAIIGEAGPEAVIPLRRLGATGALGGANITININGAVFSDDAERLAQTVGDALIDRLGLNIRIG